MAKVLITGMCSTDDRDRVIDLKKYVSSWDQSKHAGKQEINDEFMLAANLGNYLISEGARSALSGHDVKYVPFWNFSEACNPGAVDDALLDFDFCLFVTANILHIDFMLKDELEFFHAWKKPIYFMSIGIQNLVDLSGKLQAHTEAFLEILRRPNVHCFSRGPKTAHFLRNHKVNDVVEACCPSAFLYPQKIISAIKAYPGLADSFEAMWINGYLGGSASSIRDILELRGVTKEMTYVLQDEMVIFNLISAADDNHPLYDRSSAFVVAEDCLPQEVAQADIKLAAFFSPEKWRRSAEQVDFSIGRRFHGNLVAMQAGVPALFVIHDNRVDDMVSAIGAPAISEQEWTSGDSRVGVLRASVKSFDLAKALEKYESSLIRFKEALQKYGLANC